MASSMQRTCAWGRLSEAGVGSSLPTGEPTAFPGCPGLPLEVITGAEGWEETKGQKGHTVSREGLQLESRTHFSLLSTVGKGKAKTVIRRKREKDKAFLPRLGPGKPGLRPLREGITTLLLLPLGSLKKLFLGPTSALSTLPPTWCG